LPSTDLRAAFPKSRRVSAKARTFIACIEDQLSQAQLRGVTRRPAGKSTGPGRALSAGASRRAGAYRCQQTPPHRQLAELRRRDKLLRAEPSKCSTHCRRRMKKTPPRRQRHEMRYGELAKSVRTHERAAAK
jgi:hypothetical protein